MAVGDVLLESPVVCGDAELVTVSMLSVSLMAAGNSELAAASLPWSSLFEDCRGTSGLMKLDQLLNSKGVAIDSLTTRALIEIFAKQSRPAPDIS